MSTHSLAKQGLVVYHRLTRRRRLALAATTLALIPLFLLDISIGPTPIGLKDVLNVLAGCYSCSETLHTIVWSIRLPVALAAIVTGASLGLAGLLMQTILDNPLASPYTLGVSSAAAFGAALFYVFAVKILPIADHAATLNAFAFAAFACWLVYCISRFKGFTPETLVLAGIAIGSLFHALLAFVEYLASEETLQAIVFWMFGSLYKATWSKLAVSIAVLLATASTAVYAAWKLEALRLGDDVAQSLGVDVKRVRLLAFASSALLTAVSVSFYGIIGFVGLVAPHMARILVGEDHRFLIPQSMVMGAALLSAASIACKTISPGAVIPIGIVTSFIGVPFFLALIVAKKRRYW